MRIDTRETAPRGCLFVDNVHILTPDVIELFRKVDMSYYPLFLQMIHFVGTSKVSAVNFYQGCFYTDKGIFALDQLAGIEKVFIIATAAVLTKTYVDFGMVLAQLSVPNIKLFCDMYGDEECIGVVFQTEKDAAFVRKRGVCYYYGL